LVDRGDARAFTRNGFDWSDRYPGIVSSAAKLKVRSAILDGEVIVQDARGVSDFEALKSAMRWRPGSLILYAFDLLHLNGVDLRNKPLLERRSKLKELIGADPRSPLHTATSCLVTAQNYSAPALTTGWKASSRSWARLATEAAEPRPGSRPNASLKAGSF
jgi:ATP-dependent DNA ligase